MHDLFDLAVVHLPPHEATGPAGHQETGLPQDQGGTGPGTGVRLRAMVGRELPGAPPDGEHGSAFYFHLIHLSPAYHHVVFPPRA